MRPKSNQLSTFVTLLIRLSLLFLLAVGYQAELLAANNEVGAGKQTLSLGITPFFTPRRIIEIYGPVAKHLSRALGIKVRLRTAANFSKFGDQLQNEEYDIAVIQPFDYHRATQDYNYLPIARVDEPLVTTFVIRGDSPISEFSQLRGKTVVMPPKHAANARMGMAELVKHGLDVRKDVNVVYVNSHDACLHEVQIGKAAACATARPIIELFESRMKVKMKTLATTPPLPHILFVAHQRIAADIRAKLRDVVVGWRSNLGGKALLRGMRFPGFVAAADADYEPMIAINALLASGSVSEGLDGVNNRSELIFASFPYVPPKKLVQALAPMVGNFSRILNGDVGFRTTADFTKFVANVKKQYYDIIVVQPFDLHTAINAGYKPLARMSGQIEAAIYVRANTRYQRIRDLKGQTIAAPPRVSAVSHLLLDILRKSRLEVGQDIFVHFMRSHHACMEQLQMRNVDACVTAPIVVENLIVPNSLSNNLRRLETSEGVPGIVIMSGQRIAPDAAEKLKKSMLSWGNTNEGRQILKQAGFRAFIPVDLAEYKNLE